MMIAAIKCLVTLFVLCCLNLTTAIDPSENEIDSDNTYEKHPKSPASILRDEVNILQLLNISPKDQGVSSVEGPISHFPAYKFRLPYGNVLISNASNVTTSMNDPEGFTAIFLIRQQKNNVGTLMSVNSPGRLNPWFQIISNSKTGTLSLKYRLKEVSKIKQIDWGLPKHHRRSPLAAWTWLSISFNPKYGIIRLDLDCDPSRFETIKKKNFTGTFNIPEDSLVYFGQEPGRKKKFLGSIQVAKVLPYVTDQRLWSCVQIANNLSSEFRKPYS
ncbi:kielin/chordin-like protein [Diorhabda carinulata]|uniref:kielin/chordin-like protein n=1 Tax=Diorhabda carinulata TaxID=1163345 RepID=UPI0025A2D436|nr:kielin/chordin-like protein [Diorhabda carinulata]